MYFKIRRQYYYMFMLFALSIVLFKIYLTEMERRVKKEEYFIHKGSSKFDKSFPILVTAVCNARLDIDPFMQDSEKIILREATSNFRRQIEQVATMIKSATVLTSTFVNFVIAVEEDYVYYALLDQIILWPERMRKKFSIQKRRVKFPSNKSFRSLFRECTTARLFLPETMTDFDAVIYVDTDVIFMRPPVELWSEFRNFNEVQFSGLAPAMSYYEPSNKAPYYGKTGLNAGVWMMNLTRLRNFKGGWSKKVIDVFEKYEEDIQLGDQGIVNIIFSKDPQYVYDLGCHWNFRYMLCQNSTNVCQEANSKGVYILHGISASFYLGIDNKTTAVYNFWKNLDFYSSLQDLLKALKVSVKNAYGGLDVFHQCGTVPEIDHILTKGLEGFINLNVHL